MKTIGATEFKAKCLAILDEVARTGEGTTILKRGKPVAQVLPVTERDEGYPQDSLKGSVTVIGDILSPAADAEDWDAEQGKLADPA